jgi:tetratricopeptide (TPR) repeat protein
MWQALDYADVARFCNANGAPATTIDACRIGLSLHPGDPMLHVYRACAYDELGRLDEALADCEAALRLAARGPAAVFALITLALVRERLGDHGGALEAARAAIVLEPNDREAHALLGTLLAWHGVYPAAWAELECHWLDERIHFKQRFPERAEWDGEPIAGRRLLIVHAQGFGDLLQMARYVPRLRERGARVLLECAAPLRGLLQSLPGVDEQFLSGTAAHDRFDVFVRAMSLPRMCGEDGTPGNSGVPYISPGAEHAARWTTRFGSRNGRLRAGIAWAGNPSHPNDPRRSIPLAALAPFGSVPGVDWFSLQYGARANDAAPPGLALTRFHDDIGDMSDTAAIVAQLDLVISADTSIAHLAGAMGVPVWLLLPWRPDWRWSPSAADTPWYPTMRLFHAGEPRWDRAIEEAAAALRILVASNG